MQLSNLENLSKENLIFHEAKEYSVDNSKLKYKRIKIETKYPNGKKGPLVVETPLIFCFGINERKKSGDRPINKIFYSSLSLEKR